MTHSIIWALKPLILMSSLVGFCYIWDNRDSIIKKSKTRKSKISEFADIVRCCLMIVVFISGKTYMRTQGTGPLENTKNKLDIGQLAGLLIASSEDLLVASILFTELIFHRKVVNVLKDLQNVDKSLPGNPDYKLLRRNCTKILCFSIIGMYLLLTKYGTNFEVENYYGLYVFIIFWTPSINILFKLRFIGFCYIILQRFKRINEYLKKYTVVFNQRKNNDNNLAEGQLRALHICYYMHTKLYQISQRLNSIYHLPILLYASQTFTLVVSNYYYIFLGLYQRDEWYNEWYDTEDIILFFMWPNYYICELILMAYVCHRICQEWKKTGVLLHRMKNKNNESIRDMIEQWSVQLLHQKLEFTAGGFFNVDMTLIYSIIGSVTTYLVILIQFYMSGNKK